MAVTSGFFNSKNGDRRYSAEEMSAIFDGVINDGVFANIGTAFKVTADGTTNIAKVGIGRCWFNSTWLLNDAILPLTMPDSDVLYDRIDAIVIEINHSDYVRAGSIKVVKGKAAQSPQKPTLINVESLNQYAIAYVRVPAGSTTIGQQDITNNVGTSTCPYVTGILQVQNIDNIVAQWEAQWKVWYSQTEDWEQAIDTDRQEWSKEWADWYANETSDTTETMEAFLLASKAQIDKWFEDLRTNLDSQSTAVALASKIADLQYKFDTLASERAIYDAIEDSSGNPLIGSDGTEIIGKTVFEAGDGSVGEVVVENRQYTAKLLASGWEGDASSGYSQTVACAGMTANKIVLPPMFVPTGDKATDLNTQIALGYIGMVQTLDEQIQVVCYSKKPSVDLDIVLLEGAGGGNGGVQDVVIGPNTDTFFEDDSLLSSFGGKVTSVPKATLTNEIKTYVQENYARAVSANTSLSNEHTIYPDEGSDMRFTVVANSDMTGSNLVVSTIGDSEEELSIGLVSPLLRGDRFDSSVKSGCDTELILDASTDEDWMVLNGYIHVLNLNDSYADGTKYAVYCDRYTGSQVANIDTDIPDRCIQFNAAAGQLYIRDDSLSDIQFKVNIKLNPLHVWIRSASYKEENDIPLSIERHADSVYANKPITMKATTKADSSMDISCEQPILVEYHSVKDRIDQVVEKSSSELEKKSNARYARALKGVADKATSLTIYPDEDSPVSITVHGATIQEGSGDPSPENVMPIIGVGQYGTKIQIPSDGWTMGSGIFYRHDLLPAEERYDAICSIGKNLAENVASIATFAEISEDYEWATGFMAGGPDTPNVGRMFIKAPFSSASDLKQWLIRNPQWVIYNGHTEPDDIYTWTAVEGGTYETVVHKLNAPLYEGDSVTNDALSGCDSVITFDGSDDENWAASSTVSGRYFIPFGITNVVPLLGYCDRFAFISSATTSLNCCTIDINSNFFVNTAFGSLEEWKTELAKKPITLWYRSPAYVKTNNIRVDIETHGDILYTLTGQETYLHLDGWAPGAMVLYDFFANSPSVPGYNLEADIKCSHLVTDRAERVTTNTEGCAQGGGLSLYLNFGSSYNTKELAVQYIKDQYAAGTPVQIKAKRAAPAVYAHPVQEVLASPKDDGSIAITTEENATVSANYNKSITRAFEELQASVIAMGGIADV